MDPGGTLLSTFIVQQHGNQYWWWRHQMEKFSAILAICAGNLPAIDEFPSRRPVTRSFDVFYDLHLHERLSKQSWGWWFETSSRPLCRHSNVIGPNPLPHPTSNPTHPQLLTKGYTMIIPMFAIRGIFSRGGANLQNQEKGLIFQA